MVWQRIMGLLAIIPTALLLTVSFFVLFVIEKTKTQGVKVFGYVITALLCISALIVFSMGTYTVLTGRHPAMSMTTDKMMKHKMRPQMQEHMKDYMKQHMQDMKQMQ